MPTPFTSTFASAAAGSNGDSSTSRRDGAGGGDWSRSRPNGATQTFRRTSHANTSQTRDNVQPIQASNNSGVYIPPHLNSNNPSASYRNGASSDGRYTRDFLLGVYQSQRELGGLERGLEDLFLGSWDPTSAKDDVFSQSMKEGKDQYPGPEVCWNSRIDAEPLGLTSMTEDEKQLFASSVNSPIKLTQSNTKDAAGAGTIGTRKASLSGYSTTPGTGSRPGTRRRETSESFNASGPLSPTETKSFFRTESNTATPPPALLRRRTDFKDEDTTSEQKEDVQSQDDTSESQTPFGNLKRAATGPLSAGLSAPSGSPWSSGPQSSAFGSMGTFGSFAIGSGQSQESAEKRPGFGSARGGSRFKDLLSKTSSEDVPAVGKEKSTFGALEKLPEEGANSAQSRLRDMYKTRPTRSETNPYDDETVPRTGSAALSASQEGSQGIEHMGFSAFGQPANVGMRDFGQLEGPYHQTPQGRFNLHDPTSPTNTNPFQSPQNNQTDEEDPDSESAPQSSGVPPFGASRRGMFSGSDDRSGGFPPATQRSTSGFAGFGGLGGAPSWSSAGLGSGVPARDRGIGASAFGDPIFSPFSDLQSPGGSMGPGFFGSAGFGNAPRSSRLGAMFPAAMQDQMRADSRNEPQGTPFDSQQGRDPFEGGRRREDAFGRGPSAIDESSVGRGNEDSFGQQGSSSATGSAQLPSAIAAPSSTQRSSTGPDHGQSGHGLSQSSGSSSSNQMPAAQQRQMVMPDRMRWIYRDPQGNTQGPWSGLEMHDWFKAGFFTAELQVKKLEDTEYEPLAQLVRRIGNSREPFLVPQIGVPHGPPTAGQGNHWASPTLGGAAPQGGAQPPFASAFPSFGTTLTAEQQNALERRKQEEQYLMARQKEHLAQQQVYMKQMQMHNAPHAMHALQHHSSAHSLHSQPSFGSIASPNGGYQPSPMQGPIQPPQPLGPPPTSNANLPPPGREDDVNNMMNRMTFSQRTGFPYGGGVTSAPSDSNMPHSEQVTGMLQDRARLQLQQQQTDTRTHQDAFLGSQGRNDRLEEFKELRGQADPQTGRPGPEQTLPKPIGAQRTIEESRSGVVPETQPAPIGHPGAIKKPVQPSEPELLTLSQQVQRTAAANQAAESAWQKDEDRPVLPPPVSISPLPAPAAQRNRQHVADALAAESRSETETPIESMPTSVAPWAERSVDMPKGPSLKEIQEAEAKRAAEQEEIAAQARRALAEQERLAQSQAPPPAPGLPSTSTWGASPSPATPTTPSSSVWSKPSAAKASGTVANGAPKKTLAQIQKEEESRKQRAAAAAQQAAQVQTANSAAPVVGKRYAELASKVAPTPSSTVGGAWTTVGSSGKAKAPGTTVATPPTATRTVSTSSTTTAKTRPTLQPSRSSNLPNQSKANEEFTKWIKSQLGKGLNSNINLDSFTQDLMILPPEIEIISDSIYASSQTLDGRRFAEEFVRRRKLADKGIIEPAATATQASIAGSDNKSGAGGWSEVAKKGPAPKEESNAAFKVVATKKKTKR